MHQNPTVSLVVQPLSVRNLYCVGNSELLGISEEKSTDVELVELDKIYPSSDNMTTTTTEGRPSDGVALKEADEFVPSKGLTEAEAAVLLKQWGKNELPEKVTPKVRGTNSSTPLTPLPRNFT